MRSSTSRGSWLRVARVGAAIGAALTFGYALVFIVYALVRTSATILARIELSHAAQTLIANGISLVVAALIWACLFAVLAALIGLISALVLRWLMLWLNPSRTAGAASLGVVAAAVGVVALYLALQPVLWQYLSPSYPESLLFWFVLPSLVYVCAAGWGCVQLQTLREARPGQQKQHAATLTTP